MSAPGQELVPGELPAATSAEARALWEALLAATAAKSEVAVSAFDLTFEANARQERQSNQFDVRYRYLEAGEQRFARITPTEGQPERLRGPEGDFVVVKGRTTRIEGREMREDKREIDEAVSIARTFVGLSDPRRLRVARLELGSAPAQLPASVAKSAAGLRWLELASPDFQRGRADGALYRVQLGIDPRTHLPSLAVVAREQGRSIELETAQLVELKSFVELDGFKIPRQVRTFQPDPSQAPWMFASLSSLDLYYVSGTLRPRLKPDDFLPPAQK